MSTMRPEIATAWLLSLRSKNTVRAYQRILEHFLKFLSGQNLNSVQPIEIGNYLTSIAETSGIASYNLTRSALSAFFDFMIRSGEVASNPVSAFKTKPNKNTSIKLIPNEEVYRKIVSAEKDLTKQIMLHMTFVLGLRISEVLSLKPQSFKTDLNGSGFLHVVGKGSKPRDIYVPEWLLLIIADYIDDNQIGRDEKIFSSNRNRHRSISYSTAYRSFIEASKRVGLKTALPPHRYRYAHAIEALEKGAGLRDLKIELGHSSVATTLRYLEQARTASPSELFNAPTAIAISEASVSEREVEKIP